MESKIVVPATGEKISVDAAGKLVVPNNPIIPFIEGDGIGVDVTPAMLKVVDAAVEKAYKGEKKISWMEIYTGEKSTKVYGDDVWLPAETLDAMREYHVGIKGPLTTPVGGGIRSLNVALRQELDLYVCLRPVRYYEGTPSPVKQPELTDMVIFRENAEDIYAGIEWKADSAEAKKVIDFLQNEMGVKKIRFPDNCGIGIKPMSEAGTKRLVRAALEYVIDNDRDSLTLVHKGNIMKFTEGAFKDWGYQLAREEFGAELIDGGPWCQFKNPKTGKNIIVKDVIDNFFKILKKAYKNNKLYYVRQIFYDAIMGLQITILFISEFDMSTQVDEVIDSQDEPKTISLNSNVIADLWREFCELLPYSDKTILTQSHQFNFNQFKNCYELCSYKLSLLNLNLKDYCLFAFGKAGFLDIDLPLIKPFSKGKIHAK